MLPSHRRSRHERGGKDIALRAAVDVRECEGGRGDSVFALLGVVVAYLLFLVSKFKNFIKKMISFSIVSAIFEISNLLKFRRYAS